MNRVAPSKASVGVLATLTVSLTLLSPCAYAESGQKAPHFMGTGSCSSSNCHGGSAPHSGSNILQNEYVTWSKHDHHAKAWLALTTAEGRKVGENLGIAAPEKEPWCLKCHATYEPNPQLLNSGFKIEDGVTCETCHGAAENYLSQHSARDASHARNVDQGMRDLVPLASRAGFCLTCHYGSENASVTHRLMGAGHPRLSFELDTFSMLQPLHWKVDDDYVKRKAAYQNAQSWLIGQIELAKETMSALSSEARSKAGPFPELTLLTCYSCHHSLQHQQWKVREYEGHPGELRLNTAALFVVQHALQALGRAEASEIGAKSSELVEAFRHQQAAPVAQQLRGILDKAEAQLISAPLAQSTLPALLKAVVGISAKVPHLQYEFAEQMAMAMSAIVASLSPDGTLHKHEIDAVYKALSNPHEFVAEDFTASCEKFLRTL